MTIYEHLSFHRQYRIAMNAAERYAHEPGRGVELINGRMPLNTRSLADVYIIRPVTHGHSHGATEGWSWTRRE